MADMPTRVWLRVCGGGTRFPGHQGYVTVTGDSIEEEGRTVYIRADIAEAMAEALDSIRQYGSDTLSGRVDGPDDRQWQRESVLEMTRRARAALSSWEAGQ